MKKVIVLVVVLGMGTMAFGQLPAAKGMPRAIGPDAVTLDGDLGDWAGADWLTLGAGNPDGGLTWGDATDLTNAKYAARWDAAGIYVAVSLVDTVPVYELAPPSNWNSTDHIELYIDSANTNCVGYSYDAFSGPYGMYSQAQQFVISPDPGNPGGTWQLLGFPGVNPASIGVLPATVALSITGSLVEYEIYCPAQLDDAPIALGLGMTVGVDVAALSNDGTTYSMLQANGVGGKWDNAGNLQDWILIPEPITMVLLGLGGVALIRRKR